MKTVTNAYILNLALADECFLIGIPFLIVTMVHGMARGRIGVGMKSHSLSLFSGEWIFGSFLCKMYMISTSISHFSSSIFLLVMSADRYIAGERNHIEASLIKNPPRRGEENGI